AEPRAVVIDDGGRRWHRNTAAERALEPSAAPGLGEPLGPGEDRVVTLVFDLPAELVRPRLLIRGGATLERLAELVLLGDDDSLLHAPVTHALAIDD
ncbi:MAG TPA: hypothetical protein VJ773_02015, partial [Gemmatimonadales bacterium]|nr:hypothetical protein [Gemmatimonadales bacterium]